MTTGDQGVSLQGISSEIDARIYCMNRAASLSLHSDPAVSVVLRAALYLLIEDGLILIPGNGIKIYPGYVYLDKFNEKLIHRCGAQLAFRDSFQSSPQMVLDQLQRLNLIYLTEDLVNMSSLCTLKLEQLLHGTVEAVPDNGGFISGEDDPDWTDSATEAEDDDDDEGMEGLAEEQWLTWDKWPRRAVRFTMSHTANLAEAKAKLIARFVAAMGGYAYQTGVQMAGLNAILDIGLQGTPEGDWLLSPVPLQAVFDLAKTQYGSKLPRGIDCSALRAAFQGGQAALLVHVFREANSDFMVFNVGPVAGDDIMRLPLDSDEEEQAQAAMGDDLSVGDTDWHDAVDGGEHGAEEGEEEVEGPASCTWADAEPPESAVLFTLSNPAKIRSIIQARIRFNGHIATAVSGFMHSSTCAISLRTAVVLALEPGPDTDSWVISPVSLRSVYDRARKIKRSFKGKTFPKGIDYQTFCNMMWCEPSARQLVKIFCKDGKEYLMINVGRLVGKRLTSLTLAPEMEWEGQAAAADAEPLEATVYFTVPGSKTVIRAKELFHRSFNTLMRHTKHARVSVAVLRAALNLAIEQAPDGIGWIMRPVSLRYVFDTAEKVTGRASGSVLPASADYQEFRSAMMGEPSAQQVVKIFSRNNDELLVLNVAKLVGKYIRGLCVIPEPDQQPQPAWAAPGPAPQVPVPPHPPSPRRYPNPNIPTDANGDFVLSASLADTLPLVRQAVADLQGHSDLGLVAIPSDFGSPQRLDTTILALGLATSAGQAWVFHFGALRPADAREAWRLLSPLLQDGGAVKVTHDSRWLVPAVRRTCGKAITPLWDTQVAAGVSQFLTGVGGNATKTMEPQPSLNALFDAYGVSGAPELAASRPFASSWHCVKLPSDNVAFLATQAVHLLRLADKLNSELGSTGVSTVLHMSRAYAECLLPESERGYRPGGTAAQKGAAAVPRGMPLEVFFEKSQGAESARCKAVYRIGPQNEGRVAGAAPPADAEGSSGARVWAPQRPVSAGEDDPAQNADLQSMLALFPDHVAAAVVAVCRGEPVAAPAAAAAAAAPPASPLASDGREKPAPATPSRKRKYTVKRPTGKGFLWPIEIIVDAGRPMTVRLSDGSEEELPEGCQLSVEDALRALEDAKDRLGLPSAATSIFSSDNRAGVPGTLHRISAMRGRHGEVLGLTYRVGRHLEGVGELLRDVLSRLSAQTAVPPSTAAAMGITGTSDAPSSEGCSPSLLLLGPPGVGKTTLLRDVSRLLADDFRRRVVIVDTSAELAGDGAVPHRCIGRARRMWVPQRENQHEVMREAVQNHNPDAIVIDEISDSKEVAAARTIAQRGVALVGTAHGTSLETLLKNPELNPLVGGVSAVTVGDAAAQRTGPGGTITKTKLERKGAPCFTMAIELLGTSHWRIHFDVAASVDALLAGKRPATQLRWVAPDGRLMAQMESGDAQPRPGEAGVLKAAHLASKALKGDTRAAAEWVADLSLLAARYHDE